MNDEALLRVAALPGVADAVDAAREACTGLRWHPALRGRADQARAESTVRAGRASAAMDGAELPVDLVRDVLRGAVEAPDDAVGWVVTGALRATVEAGQVARVVRSAPLQALARLHTAAAAGLVPVDLLGRPRSADELPLDLAGPGQPVSGDALRARLDGLVSLMSAGADVPALVVAALVHAEVLAVRPFSVGNGVVARALFRAVVVERGLDPTGVAVPEVGFDRAGRPAYAAAVTAYAVGTADGIAAWIRFCAMAVQVGAGEGSRVGDAVIAGRLTG